MLIYYLLIVVTAIPEHWLLAKTFAGLTVIKWVGMGALAVALVHMPMRRRLQPMPRVALLAFLAYTAVQFVSCLVRGPGIANLQDFTKPIAILAQLVVVALMTDTVDKFKKVLAVLIFASAISSSYVIRQFFQFHSVYRGWRSPGASGDPNYYALAVLIWLPVCFVLFNEARGNANRLYYALLGLISVSGFVLAGSRGAFVGLVAALLFAALKSKQRLRLVPMFCLAVVLVGLALRFTPLRRVIEPSHGDTRSSENRILLWKSAWKLFLDNPLAGAGTLHFKQALQDYQDPARKLEFTAVHNTYVECASVWGLLGLVPFLLMMVTTFRALGRIARRAGSPSLTHMATAFQLAWLGYAVGAIFLSTWWFMPFWFLVFLSFMLVSLAGTERGATPAPATSVVPALAGAGARVRNRMGQRAGTLVAGNDRINVHETRSGS